METKPEELALIVEHEIKYVTYHLQRKPDFLKDGLLRVYSEARFDNYRQSVVYGGESLKMLKNIIKKEKAFTELRPQAIFLSRRGYMTMNGKEGVDAFIIEGVTVDGKNCTAMTEIKQKGNFVRFGETICFMQEGEPYSEKHLQIKRFFEGGEKNENNN